jgi:hypothetical protein
MAKKGKKVVKQCILCGKHVKPTEWAMMHKVYTEFMTNDVESTEWAMNGWNFINWAHIPFKFDWNHVNWPNCMWTNQNMLLPIICDTCWVDWE